MLSGFVCLHFLRLIHLAWLSSQAPPNERRHYLMSPNKEDVPLPQEPSKKLSWKHWALRGLCITPETIVVATGSGALSCVPITGLEG